MTPPDAKDWWFAAAALTTSLTPLHADAAGRQAGVVTTVAAANRGAGETSKGTKILIGDQVQIGETVRTGKGGYVHILFLDQSSVSLAPNTSLRIDTFSHDSAKGTGKIEMTLLNGAVRVVGGKNSKKEETVLRVPGGSIGIKGGISVIDTKGNQSSATFLFGQSMRTTDQSGNTQTITRPGFGVSSNGDSQSEPRRIPSSDMSMLLSQFETQPNGGSQGNPNPSSAPPGQLLSSGNSIGGLNQIGSQLSADRLDTTADRLNPGDSQRDVSRGLKDIIHNPIPVS